MGTRDPGFTRTELADYRATRRIVVRVNGWVMGMDKVPWVGNGWVQLTRNISGLGMGTVVKPNAGLWYTVCVVHACSPSHALVVDVVAASSIVPGASLKD